MSLLFNIPVVICKDVLSLWLGLEFLIRFDTAVSGEIFRKALLQIYHLPQFILTKVTTNLDWVILHSIKVKVICLSKSKVIEFGELIEKKVQKVVLFDDQNATMHDTTNYRSILAAFLNACKDLKEITVIDIVEFDDLLFSHCAEQFASLTHLKLFWTRYYHTDNELLVKERHFCEGGRSCLFASACKNLMSLNLWSCDTSLSESLFLALATNNSMLTSLSVRVDGAYLSDATMACLAVNCGCLIELRLTMCFLSDKSLVLVMSCFNNLRRFLYFVDENSQGAAGFQYTKCETVSSILPSEQQRRGRDVQIRHCPALFAARQCEAVVASLSDIDSVVLFAFSDADLSNCVARIIASVASSSPGLMSFQAADSCDGCDVSVVVQLMGVCTCLSVLSLGLRWGCAEFCEVFSRAYPALTSLSIRARSELTEEAVMAFLSANPQMRILNIDLDSTRENALLASSLRDVILQCGLGVTLHERMFVEPARDSAQRLGSNCD